MTIIHKHTVTIAPNDADTQKVVKEIIAWLVKNDTPYKLTEDTTAITIEWRDA